jgi:hypothetical protein
MAVAGDRSVGFVKRRCGDWDDGVHSAGTAIGGGWRSFGVT